MEIPGFVVLEDDGALAWLEVFALLGGALNRLVGKKNATPGAAESVHRDAVLAHSLANLHLKGNNRVPASRSGKETDDWVNDTGTTFFRQIPTITPTAIHSDSRFSGKFVRRNNE